jgi:transposase-like protein
MPITITLTCPHCQSDQLKRNGHTHDGRQRYRCLDCGRQHREHPRERGYNETDKQRILNAYQERSSARGIQRTFGVSRHTVAAWVKKSRVDTEAQ